MANDFLVFGGDGAANVIDQAGYAALPSRLTGFQAGVAKSDECNKAWRQSSIMGAALAQFIADVTGQDVIDDGTVATILANLKAGVSAQSPAVVGDTRNARMTLAAAAAAATWAADVVVVQSAVGGKTYALANFSQSINLATTGAGGMDTGAAPANGFVGLYAIHNPVSGAKALLGVNATSATLPEVYGGANMPAGYTASALVSVWPTNGSGQLIIGNQVGRRINRASVTVFNGSSVTGGALATISTASAEPRNAKRVIGLLSAINTTVNTTQTVAVAADGLGSGIQQLVGQCSIVGNGNAGNFTVDTPSTQTLWFSTGNGGGGTPTFTIAISSYEF
jgi:hypothetical protein